MKDPSVAMRPTAGHVVSTKYSLKDLVQNINMNGDYKDWAILCRTNSAVESIMDGLEENNIPCVTFKQGDLNKSKLEKIKPIDEDEHIRNAFAHHNYTFIP